MLRRLFGGGTGAQTEPGSGDAPVPAVHAALARLEAGLDQFAIFDAGRNRYVQVNASLADEGLYGEAVANAYLKGDARLDESAIQTLATMGWTITTADPNYSRTWPHWTGDHRSQVVDDIVGTLMLVYEMPPDGPLAVTTGT